MDSANLPKIAVGALALGAIFAMGIWSMGTSTETEPKATTPARPSAQPVAPIAPALPTPPQPAPAPRPQPTETNAIAPTEPADDHVRTPAEIVRSVMDQRRSRLSDCVFGARELDSTFQVPPIIPLVIEDGVVVDVDWGDASISDYVDSCFADALVGLDGLDELEDGGFNLPLVRH